VFQDKIIIEDKQEMNISFPTNFGAAKTVNQKRILSDLITLLPTCGNVTAQKLKNNQIYTYSDLLAFKGTIPDISVESLKDIARKQLSQNIEIACHSWKSRIVHILRSKGQITRVKVDNLLLSPHRILLNVVWQEKGTSRRKSVSPMSLMCIQSLWLTRDVVSDDSDGESYEEVKAVLPKFLIDENNLQVKNLDRHGRIALNSITKEVNQFRERVCNYSS
jgi:hypothetical protein